MIQDTQSAQIVQKWNRSSIFVIMKIIWGSSYHHNSFVSTHVLGHMIYNYIMLVTKNQIVLKKLNMEANVSGYKWSTTHRMLDSDCHWSPQCLRAINAKKRLSKEQHNLGSNTWSKIHRFFKSYRSKMGARDMWSCRECALLVFCQKMLKRYMMYGYTL